MTGMLLSASGGSSATILTQATAVITWALEQWTAFIGWMIGNPYAILLLTMFIIGFAVALMVRVLHSV